jgi:uncharacterized membrane protein
MQQFITLIATIFVGLLLDFAWIGFIAKKLYEDEIGGLLRKSNGNLAPDWVAAMIVYALLVGGIFVFAVPKAEGSPLQALIWGGLFGVVMYGVYDFTNLATLAGWSWRISLIDVVWGGSLCAILCAFAVALQNRFAG